MTALLREKLYGKRPSNSSEKSHELLSIKLFSKSESLRQGLRLYQSGAVNFQLRSIPKKSIDSFVKRSEDMMYAIFRPRNLNDKTLIKTGPLDLIPILKTFDQAFFDTN